MVKQYDPPPLMPAATALLMPQPPGPSLVHPDYLYLIFIFYCARVEAGLRSLRSPSPSAVHCTTTIIH